jgi:uncharacterized protein (DUF924 family)
VSPAFDDARAILAFWFDEVGPDRWWAGKSDELDATIRDRFQPLWNSWRVREATHFLGAPDIALAAVILFDQFPRNMFRGDALAFATDHIALPVARGAIERRFDTGMTVDQRSFLYLPFMHAEDISAQEQCVALYERLGLPDNLRFARLHRDIIAEHGRFPARNAALGRATRPEEQAAIEATKGW